MTVTPAKAGVPASRFDYAGAILFRHAPLNPRRRDDDRPRDLQTRNLAQERLGERA